MAEKRTEVQVLGEFMHGFNIMIDAVGAFIHQRPENGLKMIAIRDILHELKDALVKSIDKEGKRSGV